MGYDVQWDRVNAHVIVQESTTFVHKRAKKHASSYIGLPTLSARHLDPVTVCETTYLLLIAPKT